MTTIRPPRWMYGGIFTVVVLVLQGYFFAFRHEGQDVPTISKSSVFTFSSSSPSFLSSTSKNALETWDEQSESKGKGDALIVQSNESTTENSIDTTASTKTSRTHSTTFATNQTNQTDLRAIKSIHLIGERHTGTKWITSHLEECFGYRVQVRKRFTRFKHWFQFNDTTLVDDHSRMVVALVRNVYDWVHSMNQMPYHSNMHVQYFVNTSTGEQERKPLPWKDFVTKAWTMDRLKGGEDLSLLESLRDGSINTTDDVVCRDYDNNWTFFEVIPCSIRDTKRMSKIYARGVPPLYELRHDMSGDSYNNILELRADKLRHFINEVPKLPGAGAFVLYKYEDLVTEGTNDLVQAVQKATGIKARCQTYPPQTQKRQKQKEASRSRSLVGTDEHAKGLLQDEEKEALFSWIDDHVDWEAEAIAGYEKRDQGLR